MKRTLKILFIGLPVVFVSTAWIHNVPTNVTAEDAEYIRLILEAQQKGNLFSRRPGTFEEEIAIILDVQNAVLSHAPLDKGIPPGKPREPRTLYEVGFGLCFDRSRSIEKMLSYLGFETRHVAVYRTDRTGSALVSLLTPSVGSHAVSEVKISKGWLVIDSNSRWISLGHDGRPWSMADLQESAEKRETPAVWSTRNSGRMNVIFSRPFTYLVGLYSRHGQFYAPLTPFPDVNWRHFLGNVLPVS